LSAILTDQFNQFLLLATFDGASIRVNFLKQTQKRTVWVNLVWAFRRADDSAHWAGIMGGIKT